MGGNRSLMVAALNDWASFYLASRCKRRSSQTVHKLKNDAARIAGNRSGVQKAGPPTTPSISTAKPQTIAAPMTRMRSELSRSGGAVTPARMRN